MANNLRALSINVVSNVSLKVSFTDPLNTNIGIDNITITSLTPGAPSPLALKTRVSGNILEIGTQPLTSLASYTITFASTDDVLFSSLNNTAILFEDGIGNKQFFLGPLESTNIIKEYFLNYLNENVYNIQSGTILSNYLNVLSTALSTTLYDIRQARNENYLSVTITDERKVRAATAFDHLDEEGAYEIIRVGRTETNSIVNMSLSVDEFTTDPVSLLQANFSDTLTVNSIDTVGVFNINTFMLNLSKHFVIKLTSVVFTYSNAHLPYTYDIATYGYQILDQKYDSSYAFKFVQLENNQIKLSDKILEDPDFSSNAIFQVQVTYQYKDTGRVLDAQTIVAMSTLSSGREVLPPLYNVFNLKHGPIVTANNNIGTIGDIDFVDQNSLAILQTEHSAFLTELKFRLDFLPSGPGEYSVDYNTGTVYVFGADMTNDGTGAIPPLAIYRYRLNYKENIDWVVDTSSNDLAALPTGILLGEAATIAFDFEQVLAKDIDYKAQIHQEILDERIGNNLVALNALTVSSAPITNVFRVFNETSGEIYNVTRWNNNKIFFSYNTPPRLEAISRERINFELINNEVMFVSNIIDTWSAAIKVYKIILNNNNLMAQSEDCIGASFNTTASLSNNSIFINELYFNPLVTEIANIARLSDPSSSLGNYFIDYTNGVLYILVSSSQDFNLGTISYKRGYISLHNPHITSVEDIYYRINTLSSKEKHFEYTNFDDGFILPSTFDMADEQLLAQDVSAPYLISATQIGTFINATFVNTVTDSIQFIRNIYENDDLLYNIAPINFAESATFSNKSITVNALERQEYHSIDDGYVVVLNTELQYLSSNITLDISVIRLSDGYELWDGMGTLTFGNLLTLTLSGVNAPMVGDSVLVTYTYTIVDLSHVIVDYNKGEYYVDYTALTDEIIVSYEYGNNALDFREASALSPGETYFVSYKVGALRDALLKNFGSLIDIDVLNTFDITFGRERYRDAITGAMHSFAQGPTVKAIKDIAKEISHLPAEVNESIFESWSLGQSLLTPREFETNGDFTLLPTKHGNGISINQPDQSVTLPVVSNLKLEEGTFAAWICPEWDGLDNLAELTVMVRKDGYVASELNIFIGALEYHPTYETNLTTGASFFTLDKFKNTEGLPNRNKDGIYFYYNKDISGAFNRWFVEVIDGYNSNDVDGYMNKIYSVTINTNGKLYDLKSTLTTQPVTTKITSDTNKILFTVNSLFPNEGITFISDIQHYILDFAETKVKNRFSIFKDESGYLNFKIFDKLKNSYIVSADVSDWKQGELHHVAASWKLNTKMARDEMHLFIDGFEVPNIIRYGDRIKPYLHEKFRTVNPEEMMELLVVDVPVGPLSEFNIISANDLVTTIGSNQVTSTLDFDQYGISSGNGEIIYIEEPGFDANGYVILTVNGNTLTLNTTMPLTITDGAFVVNKTTCKVATEVDIFSNFTVSLLHAYDGYTDLNTTDGYYVVSSISTNFVTMGVQPGDLINIDLAGAEPHYIILDVTATTLTLNGNMPLTGSGVSFHIYRLADEEEIPGLRATHPAYGLSKSTDGYFDNILTLRDKVLINDLVLVRTLGINHRKIKRRYYVWSNQTNILKTKLPTPLSLDEVNIRKILLSSTFIGPANASLVFGVDGYIFNSTNILTDLPSNTAGGRTLSVSMQGDNVDFTVDGYVEIAGITISTDGYGTPIPTIETLVFTEAGVQDTVGLFAQVAYVTAQCKPLNQPPSTPKNCAIIEIKEKYSITKVENLSFFVLSPNTIPQPVIRYSYQVGIGLGGALSGDGYTVTDGYNFFSSNVVGNDLIISSANPISAAGFYKIGSVSPDHTSLELIVGGVSPLPLPSFTDGYYEILNTSDFRSGLQNGYFTFEYAHQPGEPYYLTGGLYELDYYTYLGIPFDLQTNDMHIGSDFEKNCQLYGSIDELQIFNTKLTDTRIGETAANTQRTITKEFNSIKAPKADTTSLVLTHFDTLPPVNEADIYLFADKNIFQAGEVINDNFTQSICLTDHPLIIDNDGILNTKKEATIEFWVNPIFDTSNDPNYRFYFDAYGAVSEDAVSINSTTIQLKGTASEVFQVKLQGDESNVNYFAGGEIIDNGQTLSLHNELPNQNTNVIITYLPKGLKGDRISLYKDPSGYMTFNITANELDYQVRAPIYWARNTWHRVKATYTINSGTLLDEIHLFLDGYERGNVLFGSGLIFGQGAVYGSSFSGPNATKHNIKFVDPINRFSIGSDFNAGHLAYCLMDNIRISNIARSLYQPFGEPLDPNYSSNLQMVFPITEDLNTTLLINFDTLVSKNTDFITLNSRTSGLADFSVNILDSFGIINNNSRVKEVLEALLKSFKPANSRAFINYL